MELRKITIRRDKIAVCPIGDIQYSGSKGPTAVTHVVQHIRRCLSLERDGYAVRFIGMGDYIDFLSPSNRKRLDSAQLYDSAKAVVHDKARELVQECYDQMLAPTRGKWLGLLEGHHLYEAEGETSDMWLCEMLKCDFLGTSCYIRLDPSGFVLWAHHGQGSGTLPSSGINKLYHTSAGLGGADVYFMGHNTKMGVARISRPMPNASFTDLTHRDVLLVNTGGFSKSNVVGHRQGKIARGDYAEQAMMTPSPLAAPIVLFDKTGVRCQS